MNTPHSETSVIGAVYSDVHLEHSETSVIEAVFLYSSEQVRYQADQSMHSGC